jgi:hypothetical protein
MGLRIKSKRKLHVDVEYKARVAKDKLSTAIRVHRSCALKMEAVCCSEDVSATYWPKQEFVTQNTIVLRSPNVFQILYKTL